MAKLSIGTAIGLFCCLAAFPAASQQPPDTNVQKAEPAQPELDRKACAGDRRATIGQGNDTALQAPKPEQPLSEKLAATEGVICPPPDIDPDIRAPAPGGGVTPVLPPPGSPGGDPSIRPK